MTEIAYVPIAVGLIFALASVVVDQFRAGTQLNGVLGGYQTVSAGKNDEGLPAHSACEVLDDKVEQVGGQGDLRVGVPKTGIRRAGSCCFLII